MSGLKRTLTKFGERYVELVARFGREDVAKRFFFAFEINRPIAETVTDAIVAIKAGADDTILVGATGLSCLVAERCWDQVRCAIEEYAWRFEGLRRRASHRRRRM